MFALWTKLTTLLFILVSWCFLYQFFSFLLQSQYLFFNLVFLTSSPPSFKFPLSPLYDPLPLWLPHALSFLRPPTSCTSFFLSLIPLPGSGCRLSHLLSLHPFLFSPLFSPTFLNTLSLSHMHLEFISLSLSLSLSLPVSLSLCVEMVCIDPLSNRGEGQRFTNKAQGQNRDTQTNT